MARNSLIRFGVTDLLGAFLVAAIGTAAIIAMGREIVGPLVGVRVRSLGDWESAALTVPLLFALLYLALRRHAVDRLDGLLAEGERRPVQGIRDVVSRNLRCVWLVATFRPNLARAALTGQRRPLLEALDPGYQAVFCSTDLRTRSPVMLMKDSLAVLASESENEMATYEVGRIPLSKSVMASAAFPGVFQPVNVRVGRSRRRLRLADGGLIDNYGLQGIEVAHGSSEALASIVEVLIADSAAPPPSRSGGPIGALREAMRTLHVANSEARLTRARDRSTVAIASIHDNPETLIRECEDADRAARAQAALERIGEAEALPSWEDIVAASIGVKTSLRRLPAGVLQDLVMHGYCAALTRSIVDLGWEAPTALPSRADFRFRD